MAALAALVITIADMIAKMADYNGFGGVSIMSIKGLIIGAI
ncbi:hypothetical protein MTBBW1_1630034 [Desulfamplus magnetovallimortis]|uniref:Uncharacterized protein n=1 Tax=Desulfamplus magnetovallimortis TaxID=1246637 RepID=A0A1W1H918_9BACT|nr:hypothetical protein [Desulfamplus magnetovallimortis]SLM28924.1 hypothetical protein MTBBW1_1630034 [Desulfamplus magnetovallimortis]